MHVESRQAEKTDSSVLRGKEGLLFQKVRSHSWQKRTQSRPNLFVPVPGKMTTLMITHEQKIIISNLYNFFLKFSFCQIHNERCPRNFRGYQQESSGRYSAATAVIAATAARSLPFTRWLPTTGFWLGRYDLCRTEKRTRSGWFWQRLFIKQKGRQQQQ